MSSLSPPHFTSGARQTDAAFAFGSNAGFNLSDAFCLSPDAAWLSRERWKNLTPEQQAGFPPLCPEFIIEIRSRADSRRLLETRMQLWLDNGAQLAWLIDPIDQTVTVHSSAVDSETLRRPQSVIAIGPVAGFELRTSTLWT